MASPDACERLIGRLELTLVVNTSSIGDSKPVVTVVLSEGG